MKTKDAIKQVAKNNNMPVKFVKNVYKAYWRAIREHMVTMPLKETLTQEEFEKLRPNVSVNGIGKFYVLYPKYIGYTKRYQELVKKIEHVKDQINKADAYQDSDNSVKV